MIMDNKKRIEEGALVAGLFVWAMALIITLAFILNNGDAFRVVCVLLLLVPNVFSFVKVIKYIKENYRSLYDKETKE